MTHQLTEEDEKIKKHVSYLQAGNSMTISTAIAFFDKDFLPTYNPEVESLRVWHHQWLCAFKTALSREVSTMEQKLQLLERIVCNADRQCALSVVVAYLQRCAPGQHKSVETMLRKKAPWTIDSSVVRDLFPYSLG